MNLGRDSLPLEKNVLQKVKGMTGYMLLIFFFVAFINRIPFLFFWFLFVFIFLILKCLGQAFVRVAK